MISILSNSKIDESKNSINITYPRNVNIIFGHYAYPDIIHNFILQIKDNLDPNMLNYSNVKGGRTNWKFFLNEPSFKKFFYHIVNKHQLSHPHLFEYFLERYELFDAWGNEIKPKDYVEFHMHHCYHGILYLTEGCDLILPELNIKITPKPGDYYIFPPEILHGFDEYKGQNNRYSLVFNIFENKNKFKFKNKLSKFYE